MSERLSFDDVGHLWLVAPIDERRAAFVRLVEFAAGMRDTRPTWDDLLDIGTVGQQWRDEVGEDDARGQTLRRAVLAACGRSTGKRGPRALLGADARAAYRDVITRQTLAWLLVDVANFRAACDVLAELHAVARDSRANLPDGAWRAAVADIEPEVTSKRLQNAYSGLTMDTAAPWPSRFLTDCLAADSELNEALSVLGLVVDAWLPRFRAFTPTAPNEALTPARAREGGLPLDASTWLGRRVMEIDVRRR
ncbi:MAG: hypothetical protein IT182_02070 [Acidobacteria bacterium]|nr:hypothetical protein [Acidobacteriota bacterium]